MATVDTLLVRIEADMEDLKRDLKKVTQQTERSTNQMADGFRRVGRAVAALGGAAIFGAFLKSTVQTGAQVEGLRVQLDALLGSAEEGGKAFQIMTRFASRVPFSLKQIQQGAGGLGAAAKNAEELGELMQITGNIAAQFNIPFEEAAANVQRALSAGIGAADQFRDRGVSAFAGFQAGVSYSASETAKILQDTFGTGGTADGAMDQFAKTTQGAMSMLGDAVFNFQATMAGSGLNEGLTDLVRVITDVINNSRVFAAVIGSVLGNALTLLGQAVEFVVGHFKDIIYYFGLFVAARFVMAFTEGAFAALKYARAINAVSLAKKALTALTKRNVIAILAVAGVAAFASKELEGFLKSVGDLGSRIFSQLPPEMMQFFDETVNEAYEAINKVEEAQRAFDTEFGALGTGTSIQLSTTGVDAGAMMELQKLLDKNTYSTGKLKSEIDQVRKALAGDLPEAVRSQAIQALASLENQLANMNPLFATMQNAVIGFGQTLSNQLADAVMNGRGSMKDLKEAFRNMVKQIIAQAIQLMVVNRILSMMFPGAFSQVGHAFVPVRASGGAMNAGQPYMVGERGPELIVPQSASRAVNAGQTRGMSGGEGVTVVQNLNISTGVSQTVRAEVRAMMPQIAENAKNAVLDGKRRGGAYGRGMA